MCLNLNLLNCQERTSGHSNQNFQMIPFFPVNKFDLLEPDQQLMDIRDFQGLTKYKIVIPILYLLSWIFMFTGPSFFPAQYETFCLILIIYFILKVTMMAAITFMINIKSIWIFDRVNKKQTKNQYSEFLDRDDEINYCFIIPNYKQQIQLLSETLDILSAHERAKQQYIIFLAMQAHENGSDLKAKQLVQNFKDCFRIIDFTIHQIRPNQQKGKASNVSWCAQHIQPVLLKNMINPDTVFLTIIDADSWAPNLYIELLDEHIKQNYDQRYTFIYHPPQIFTRNNFQVSVLTRVCDMVHSAAQLGYLYSTVDLHFALSNYSVSFKLMKKIGFWDTCEDAIAQDLHTTHKAYWKTNGEIKTIPIYAPFNQANLSTGNGHWQDIKAKFWQTQRHGLAVADVAYGLKMLINQPFRFKNLIILYFVSETFVIMGTLPWALLAINYQYRILFQYQKPSPQLLTQSAIDFVFLALSFVSLIAYVNYEIFKRRANKIIYKQENESIFRMIEYLILSAPLMLIVSGGSFMIAAFQSLIGTTSYNVADKKNVVKKKIQNS